MPQKKKTPLIDCTPIATLTRRLVKLEAAIKKLETSQAALLDRVQDVQQKIYDAGL